MIFCIYLLQPTMQRYIDRADDLRFIASKLTRRAHMRTSLLWRQAKFSYNRGHWDRRSRLLDQRSLSRRGLENPLAPGASHGGFFKENP
jgi:hypothetical protein